jgi:hypothetical protein
VTVLELAAAKEHLNIRVATNDAELETFIDAAEAVLARWVGPLEPTPVTDRVAGYGFGLHLPVFPALSLTSVTPVGGGALDLAGLYLDVPSGTVTRNDGGQFTARAYDVAWVAGRDELPDDLLFADKELVRELWTTQRGTARPAEMMLGPMSDRRLPGSVALLIARHRQLTDTLGA